MRILMDFEGVDNVPLHPVSVNDVLRNTLSLLQNEIKEKMVKVDTEFDESSPSVMAREDIIRAFYNVCMNAIEAMSATEVRVMTAKTEVENDTVKITFSDTGTGVPSDSMSRLIEPFFTTKEFGRLGMGLSTSYSLIKNYGGDIKFTNNEGLSVIITLRRAGGVK
jgi:two-component system C4-dicarboxylate transport sensor histidine kinase DctB